MLGGSKTKYNKFLECGPIIGICLFFCLYFFASRLYPGGSQADLNSVGFDWFQNYWCNLLNEKAMNGAENPAKPLALLAMVILCGSLMIFFIQFPILFRSPAIWKRMIQYSGISSLIVGVFIFTDYHDLITFFSSFFGMLALIGIIREIYLSDLTYFKIIGVGCILLILANNYIYYSTHFLEYLPILQKVTFILVLGWVIKMNQWMYKRVDP